MKGQLSILNLCDRKIKKDYCIKQFLVRQHFKIPPSTLQFYVGWIKIKREREKNRNSEMYYSPLPYIPFPYRCGTIFMKWASIWWDSRGLDKASIETKGGAKDFPSSTNSSCSVQTEREGSILTQQKDQRRHPHKRQPSPFPIRAPGESSGKELNGKAKRKVIREGRRHSRKTASIDTRTVQSAQSNLAGSPGFPTGESQMELREEPPFQFRLTISIRTRLRNNRSNTSPTEWFSPTACSIHMLAPRGPFYYFVSR